MKILYVINSLEGGGAAFPVPRIAGALRSCGAEVRIAALTRRDGRALASIEAAGLAVDVRGGGETDHGAALRWLDGLVAAEKPDILWTSLSRATLLGQIVGARRRVPVVSWQHAAYLRPANRRLLRVTRRLTALWIADSRSVGHFAREALRISGDRLIIWPIFAADPSAPQALPWRPGEPLRIASIGRLHPVKGYDVLVAALARVDAIVPFEVTIAGDGAEREALQSAIDRAGLTNVRLAGFADDPRALLATQHLYVQPSRSEGFCVAAHEAIQAGLPVIGSAVGEMAQSIVAGTTGWLVIPRDSAALAEAISECLARPGTLHAMGVVGRQRLLDRFSDDRFQRGAEAIYRRLAALCRSGPRPGRRSSDRSA